MRILVTGASGFIGKNLLVHLKQHRDIEVATLAHGALPAEMAAAATV